MLPKVKKILWPVDELKQFFATYKIPAGPIQFDVCSKITDPAVFIDSHLATIIRHNGTPTYRVYFDRLVQLRALILKPSI